MNQIENQAPVRSRARNDRAHRRWRRAVRLELLALTVGCALLATVGAAPALASFGVTSFSNAVINQDGTPATQAGSHPYEAVTTMAFTVTSQPEPTENVKDVVVGLPPGLIGNPNTVPKCTIDELDNNQCPGASQIGQLTIGLVGHISFPLFNLVPPAGEPALFGARLVILNAYLDVTVRTGSDYGLTTTSSDISTLLPFAKIQVTLWGVPADPSHDADRVCAGHVTPCSSDAPMTPFLTLPTSCTGPLTSTLRADSWQHPGEFVTAASTIPGITGCGVLSFDPSISVQPDTSIADSPAGLNVDVHIPQAPDDPSALAAPDLETAIVDLPAGVAVNPAAADGLQACTPSQIGLDNGSEPTCPEASKVGAVEIDSPIQADPLKGSIYLAQQNNNPFGSLLAIYVTAESDGVLIKLAGEIAPNPVTGQLTVTFDNNPQLPFTDFKLEFFGGNRASLVTPDSCGAFTTTSSMAPWSGTDAAAPSSSFTIDSGCVSGFSPSFIAGVSNPQAGAFTPFGLSFARSDADQQLAGLTAVLPPGMLAKLGDVPLCADAAANSGTCPAASQVGTVETGVGAGSNPFFLSGNVYLTGPYKGAPYGLVVVVRALAGPLNLGTVVVRQALYVDPTTAQVTAVSDPFPTILDGIPLRIRRIDVSLDRPGFTLNPTSCDPMAVTGTLSSVLGATEAVGSRFQVGGCGGLGFNPKLKLVLSGNGQTRSGSHPTLTATLTQPSGQTDIRSAKVALPLSLALDPNNSQHVCNYYVALAVHGGGVGCPSSTVVGTATAVTPLLDQPLTGPVYLVQGIRFNAQGQAIHTLPSLLIPLRGQIALDLRAQSSVSGGKLVTTFNSIPDAPVSKFTLQIAGGAKGLLVITGRGLNICKSAQVANASFGAQSDNSDSQNDTLGTPCAPVKHATKQRKRHVIRKHARHARLAGLAVRRFT